jgi:hypothetical protein
VADVIVSHIAVSRVSSDLSGWWVAAVRREAVPVNSIGAVGSVTD